MPPHESGKSLLHFPPFGIYLADLRALLKISAQKEVVEDLERQVKDLEQEWRSTREHVTTCKQARTEHQRHSQELNLKFQSLDDHAEGLRDALERDNLEDGGIEALKSTLKELEDEQRVHEGSLTDSQTAMAEMTHSIIQIRRTLKEKDESITELEGRAQVAESERSRVDIHRRQIISEKNEAIARIDKDKRDRGGIYAEQVKTTRTIDEYIEMSNRISPRVPVDEGESCASLDRKLTRLLGDMERTHERYVLLFSRG